jgi:hypothetical protein
VEAGLLTPGRSVNLLVQEHLDGLPELQGRGSESAEGPDTFCFSLSLSRMQALGHDEVQSLQRLIQGYDCKGLSKREQGGQPPCRAHLGHGLGAGGRAVTR